MATQYFQDGYTAHLDAWIRPRVGRLSPRVKVKPKRVVVRDLVLCQV